MSTILPFKKAYLIKYMVAIDAALQFEHRFCIIRAFNRKEAKFILIKNEPDYVGITSICGINNNLDEFTKISL